MPPAPIWPVISYGPSRVPGANDTVTRSNYTGMPRREGIGNDQRRSGDVKVLLAAFKGIVAAPAKSLASISP